MSRDLTNYLGSILIAVSLTSLAWAGQRDVMPTNWAQVDAPAAWECPTSQDPYYGGPQTFAALPASVAITTGGRPVVVSVSMDVNGGGFQYRLVIDLTVDGVAVGAGLDVLSYYGGTHTLTRIVPVTSGAHSFGVTLSCITGGTNALMVKRGWVSVFEL